MIEIKVRPAEAEDARKSSSRVPRTIAKFPNAEIDCSGLKSAVHVLISGFSG